MPILQRNCALSILLRHGHGIGQLQGLNSRGLSA
jgi:hypothetical protein